LRKEVNMKALQIRNLKKSFRSNFLLKTYQILKDIDINVEEGEIYGFLGPNGAGKTTTIKCILRLIYPDNGEIEIFGTPHSQLASRKKVGYLPEHPYFYDYLTGKELLLFTGRLFSISPKESASRADELLRLVGLENKKDLKLRKYSKGMIQRIGLAQSLINDPDLVILDEPFSGLDPIGRKELRDIILSLKGAGKTIFFSSHILQDMELIVDKVGIIQEGRITREGKLSELISHSVQSYETLFSGLDEAILKEHKIQFQLRDRNFLVVSPGKEEANSLIQLITANKGNIISVSPIKMTLEDIFLKELK